MGGASAIAEGIQEALDLSDDSLTACVHCGFCVPVCPTWDILREENDSPRGRLYLMRAEIEGRVDPAGAFADHIGRCVGCRACETVCPAGVPYGHLLEQARARIPLSPRARSSGDRFLELLTGTGSQRLYALGRLIRRLGIAHFVGRLMPGLVGRALRLLGATKPALSAAIGQPAGAPSESAERYALLEGCVMAGLFGHVHEATRRTLATAGLREVRASEARCCGALHAHAGRLAAAREMARVNIAAFETTSEAWIVTNSAGCGAALRDYPAWLEADPEWRDRAAAVAERVRDVTELLACAVTQHGLGATVGSLEGRVGYDAPCHLVHAQGVRDEPLAVLRSVAGLRVEALPSSDRCCGGAGLYGLTEPDLADAIASPKLDEIRSGKYDWIATGNPGCIMYIGAGLRLAGVRTPVVHPVELVDLAWHGRPGS